MKKFIIKELIQNPGEIFENLTSTAREHIEKYEGVPNRPTHENPEVQKLIECSDEEYYDILKKTKEKTLLFHNIFGDHKFGIIKHEVSEQEFARLLEECIANPESHPTLDFSESIKDLNPMHLLRIKTKISRIFNRKNLIFNYKYRVSDVYDDIPDPAACLNKAMTNNQKKFGEALEEIEANSNKIPESEYEEDEFDDINNIGDEYDENECEYDELEEDNDDEADYIDYEENDDDEKEIT